MNWRLSTTVLSGACVALLTLLLLRGCDKPETAPQDETLWRVKVEQREAVIREKDSVIASLNSLRSAEKSRHTSDSVKQVKAVARIFKRYSEAREQVQQLSDSTGRIERYVSATDSLLAAKDSLYSQEVNHRIALDLSYRSEIAALGEKHVQQVAISQEYAARVEQLSKQNVRLEKRLERKKKGTRIWAGIALGLGAAVGVMSLTE